MNTMIFGRARRPWTPEEEEEAWRPRLAGKTFAAIGRQIGRDATSVACKLDQLARRRDTRHGEDLRATRRCLCCAKDFPSEWKGNRICPSCKTGRDLASHMGW